MKLYKIDVGAPTRAVMMACELLNLPVDMIDVNLPGRENFTSKFLQKNPLHTVPILEDGDICLHDSHAILMYLADVYGNDDTLYPKNVKKRALVNQKLFFEATVVFPRMVKAGLPIFIDGFSRLTDRERNDVYEVYHFMEEFLTRSRYIADEHMTIADLSIIASISTLVYIIPLNANKYPKTRAWMEEMERQHFYEKYNKPGATALGELFTEVFHKN